MRGVFLDDAEEVICIIPHGLRYHGVGGEGAVVCADGDRGNEIKEEGQAGGRYGDGAELGVLVKCGVENLGGGQGGEVPGR